MEVLVEGPEVEFKSQINSIFESFLVEGGARGANGGSSEAARQARAPLRSGSITRIKLFSDH